MQNTKLLGFVRGIFYPLLMTLLTYVIANLGASGLVSVGTATTVTAILSLVEHYLESESGKAMFGMIKTSVTYSD